MFYMTKTKKKANYNDCQHSKEIRGEQKKLEVSKEVCSMETLA